MVIDHWKTTHKSLTELVRSKIRATIGLEFRKANKTNGLPAKTQPQASAENLRIIKTDKTGIRCLKFAVQRILGSLAPPTLPGLHKILKNSLKRSSDLTGVLLAYFSLSPPAQKHVNSPPNPLDLFLQSQHISRHNSLQ